MSACEKCWNEAATRTMLNGGSQFDNYVAVLREHSGDDPHISRTAEIGKRVISENRAVLDRLEPT